MAAACCVYEDPVDMLKLERSDCKAAEEEEDGHSHLDYQACSEATTNRFESKRYLNRDMYYILTSPRYLPGRYPMQV